MMYKIDLPYLMIFSEKRLSDQSEEKGKVERFTIKLLFLPFFRQFRDVRLLKRPRSIRDLKMSRNQNP